MLYGTSVLPGLTGGTLPLAMSVQGTSPGLAVLVGAEPAGSLKPTFNSAPDGIVAHGPCWHTSIMNRMAVAATCFASLY